MIEKEKRPTPPFFSERLKKVLEVLSEKNYQLGTHKGIVDEIEKYGGIKIVEQTLSYYLKTKRLPQLDVFLGIVKFCNHYFEDCFNSDYLLGISDTMDLRNRDVNIKLGLDDKTIKVIDILSRIDDEKNEEPGYLLKPFAKLLNSSNLTTVLHNLFVLDNSAENKDLLKLNLQNSTLAWINEATQNKT